MFKYLRAAFLVGFDVPGLGQLPLNAMAVAAAGILGFAEPSLWLAGLGLESAFLLALSTNTRFQKVVDSRQFQLTERDAEAKRRELIRQLPYNSQQRLFALAALCQRITEIGRQSDDFLADTNRDALERLQWTFLKLLVARKNLESAETLQYDLERQVSTLEAELRNPSMSSALRESKAATLAILHERLANVNRRKETLDEIDADLARIEAQAQLALENASIQGKPTTIGTDFELASNLAGSGLYGDSGTAIEDLERSFKTSHRQTE